MDNGEPNTARGETTDSAHERSRFRQPDKRSTTGASSPRAATAEDQALCLSCGLCCTGAIFGRVALKDDTERARIEAVGLSVKVADRVTFDQPCSAHKDQRCTIYDQRPRTCRTFRCKLLMRVAAGEESPAAARKIVSRALSLKEQCLVKASEFDDKARSKSIHALDLEFSRRLVNATSELQKRQYAQVLLYVRFMVETVSKHFWKGDQNPTAE